MPSRPLAGYLIAAAETVSAQDQVRAVVVRGRGGHFSVGADLKATPPAEPPSLQARRRSAELGARLIRTLQEIRQPTVCAIHGAAHGGGACIATACDFRIAASNARMGYGEVRLGMPLMWHALPLPSCTWMPISSCWPPEAPTTAKVLPLSSKSVNRSSAATELPCAGASVPIADAPGTPFR